MNIFIDEHQNLLRLLQQHNVEFLLIGGYAVIFHGYKRTTGDMDLWLRPTNENKEKLVLALKEDGFEANDLKVLDALNFEDHLVFSYGIEPLKVDFITRVNLVTFDEANVNKIVREVEDVSIPVKH